MLSARIIGRLVAGAGYSILDAGGWKVTGMGIRCKVYGKRRKLSCMLIENSVHSVAIFICL